MFSASWSRCSHSNVLVARLLVFAFVCAGGAGGCDKKADEPALPRATQRSAPAATSSAASLDEIVEQDTPRGKDPTYGQVFYSNSCISCHGSQGQGMPHQGASLRESKFIAQQSDEQLVEFLKKGRQPDDPKNLSRQLMPPRGGNAGLDDTGLGDVVAYLRQMQKESHAAAIASMNSESGSTKPVDSTVNAGQ